MKKEELVKFFKECKKDGLDIVVKIKIPNQKKPEVIMNYNSNIDNKIEYYKNNYNEKLEHKNNKEIKIIDMLATNIPF